MKSLIRFVFSVGLLVLLSMVAMAQTAPKDVDQTFSFVVLSDTHLTAASDLSPYQKMLETAKGVPFPAQFAIVTGDVTEAGRPEEFAKAASVRDLLKAGGVTLYAVPGNHDVRWSATGKSAFTDSFGKAYQSFDYGAAHFLLLDTTVLLEHWGHLDRQMLDWMAKDLRKVKPQTPIFVFMHHWIGREDYIKRPIDNEPDLWQYSTERELVPLLKGRNVMAIFTGHGHQNSVWKTNGVSTLMTGKFEEGSYHLVTVSPLQVTVDRYTKQGGSKPESLLRLAVRGEKKSQLRAGFDDPGVPFLARRRPSVLLDPRAFEDTSDHETGEYRIDNGEWMPLTRNMRDIWSAEFATKPVPVGVHAADIRIVTTRKTTLTEELIFEVEREETDISRRWATNLEDGIQGSPALYEDLALVGANDGRVYGLDRKSGKIRWRFATKKEITGTPLVVGDTAYIGSNDGGFYALEAKTGKQIWRYPASGPIVGTAGFANGIVAFGAGNSLVGLDAAKGTFKWEVKTGGFNQSRIATDGTNFYGGYWDNSLIAVDAQSGNLKWKKSLGVNKDGVSSFYFAPAIAAPAVEKNRVFVASNDGMLRAFDTGSGDEQWAIRAPVGGDNLGYSSPAVNGYFLYIAGLGDKGNVYCFDTISGKIVWNTPIGQSIYDSSVRLAPDGNSLVIAGVRGRVALLDAKSGQLRYKYELGPGNVFATPEYDGATIYTATMARDVQALAVPGVATLKK